DRQQPLEGLEVSSPRGESAQVRVPNSPVKTALLEFMAENGAMHDAVREVEVPDSWPIEPTGPGCTEVKTAVPVRVISTMLIEKHRVVPVDAHGSVGEAALIWAPLMLRVMSIFQVVPVPDLVAL